VRDVILGVAMADENRNRSGISGIKGAVPSPSYIPQNITPISDRQIVLPTSPILQSSVMGEHTNIPSWECGFTIYIDETTTLPSSSHLHTPRSKRALKSTTSTNETEGSIPTTSSKSRYNDDDQENIPPPMTYSTSSTPSKSSQSVNSTPSTRHSLLSEDLAYLSAGSGGSGRRRRIGEKSRLGLGDSVIAQREEEEELTPGRRVVSGLSEGKKRLVMELNGED
jgi:hypothetical protein